MSPDQFRDWRIRMGLSKSEAATAIGLSRNMPNRYENGSANIPLYVALACAAYAMSLKPYGSEQ